jgi:c-di-GMP-binding flagellar brake protein YcgR
MTGGIDRRQNIRVNFSTSVRVREKGENGTEVTSDQTRDISLKGLYCVTEEPFPEGTECEIALRLSGESSDLFLFMDAVVARTGDDGMGLKFQSIDIDSFYHLKNILYYNSGSPEVIDREIAGVD